MIKGGLDQTSSWIAAVIVSSLVFTGAYFLTKNIAVHVEDEDGQELHASPEAHHDDGHPAAEDKTDAHDDKAGDHHDEKPAAASSHHGEDAGHDEHADDEHADKKLSAKKKH